MVVTLVADILVYDILTDVDLVEKLVGIAFMK